jgi:predicted SAM-dependent methyltransferase
VNLGCGDEKLLGFLNVDVKQTRAVDIVKDLAVLDFPEDSVQLLFANAFFEHLFRNKRVSHLRSAYRALAKSGAICYIGIPDFKVVAESYLNRVQGIVGERFDLFNVYRYTHGDPEQPGATDWLAQLHKSLFDDEELENLLVDAGFENHVVFNYIYPNETIPLCMGFYAKKGEPRSNLKSECINFLRQFEGKKVLVSSVRFTK